MGHDMASLLLELRTRHGFSQEKSAEMLGVTRQAISKWENGQGLPDANNLINIAALYSVSLDYIMLGKKDAPENGPMAKPMSPLRIVLLALLGFAGVSLVGVLFLFLLTLFTQSIA